ncbi:hypothetical protein FCJ61_40245 [Burkholderia metallica]|nr:hypothetical protein [Burkholderia metallica]
MSQIISGERSHPTRCITLVIIKERGSCRMPGARLTGVARQCSAAVASDRRRRTQLLMKVTLTLMAMFTATLTLARCFTSPGSAD